MRLFFLHFFQQNFKPVYSVSQVVTKGVLFCTQKEKQTDKNFTIMGASYSIKCKKCGTTFMHIADDDFGVIRACVGCQCSIDTEVAILCPACMTRVNRNKEEFESQIESVMTW